MRLAYFSPLTPQRSGIADYSEELLPYLKCDAEVTLFVEGFRPANESLVKEFEWVDYRSNPAVLSKLNEFDAVVYHLGNDHRYHTGIFETSLIHPGVTVFHDFALQDFFLGLARMRGDMSVYLDEVAACNGQEMRDSAAEALVRGALPQLVAEPTVYPLNRRLARRSEGIIVHSTWCRTRFKTIAPAVPIRQINMPVRLSAIARSHTGSSNHPIRIASFGLITPGKGIEQALRALSVLKDSFAFQYTLVGEPSPFFPVRELIERSGLSDRVRITGHVSLDEFERHMRETDIALNMRERTVGETSASLCRIMIAGVPSVVYDVGWYAELPNDCVVKVDKSEYADALLLAYLRKLISDQELRARIGRNARHYAEATHAIEPNAAAYIEFISEIVAQRSRRKLITFVSGEVARLGIKSSDQTCLTELAGEIAALFPSTPESVSASVDYNRATNPEENGRRTTERIDNPPVEIKKVPAQKSAPRGARTQTGRLPKLEGVDYKRAAVEYLRKLDPERSHYLKTKPFYNLANKPAKHRGDGMDSETHRHFSDFANIAVALALPAGARILDVGCGSGWLSEYFARLGYDVTGADISDELVAMAAERVARIPYNVDHETALRCRFLVQDIEAGPLPEKFDAVICYDSLHHMEDERAVLRHIAAMLDQGGLLFILEGHKPPANSPTEAELCAVMRRYETLESPFSYEYLLELLDQNGFAVVGDYVSVNGLFEREMLEDNALPLRTLPINYHYLTCMKVATEGPATSVPSSRRPGMLRAQISLLNKVPANFAPGTKIDLSLEIKNAGDTLWLTGQTVRAGVVMPAVKVFDARGNIMNEFHGEPMLPRAVAPGQAVRLRIAVIAPLQAGAYSIKIDLVNQHICWFEDRGSLPLTLAIEVVER